MNIKISDCIFQMIPFVNNQPVMSNWEVIEIEGGGVKCEHLYEYLKLANYIEVPIKPYDGSYLITTNDGLSFYFLDQYYTRENGEFKWSICEVSRFQNGHAVLKSRLALAYIYGSL